MERHIYICVVSIIEDVLMTPLKCSEWERMLKLIAPRMLLKETCFIA